MKADEIISIIKAELAHQDKKWGSDRHLDCRVWISILGEEFGEVCHANLEHDPENYVEELVDVAAVCIAAIQDITQHDVILEDRVRHDK